MKTLVTLSDKYYLDRGIALFESINKFDFDFRLYYLCLDRETFDKLTGIDKIIPIHISIFNKDKAFRLLAKNHKSSPNQYSDFHFALASFFTNYVMDKTNQEVLHIDADILFYRSPEVIFESVKGKSVDLILHRHNKIGTKVGGFNVGIVYFRNDDIGKKCLKWWRDVVLNTNNKYHKTHGTCGDQKYLELFSELFGRKNIKILDENIGHGAPWNLLLYDYLSGRRIKWKGLTQDLVLTHFSHFSYNENSYKIMRKKEWNPELLNVPEVKVYYDEYFEILKDVKKRYEL